MNFQKPKERPVRLRTGDSTPFEEHPMKLVLAACAAAMTITGAIAAESTTPASGTTAVATCADMITKAKAMAMPTDAAKAKAVADELAAAQTAQTSGDEATCKTHVTNAMNAMGGM
jgi:hypothetical protein